MSQTLTQAAERVIDVAAPAAPSLREMLEDGIYLLFLLKEGNPPSSAVEFNRRVDQFLGQFERNARNFGKDINAVGHAKYAFCALMDEIILSSDFALRDEWERMPLQLRLFGEHLAGEGFFNRLEQLRDASAANVEALEVFYTCLLLGFQGKYLLEGQEKLGYLVHKLGQEIQQARGGKAEFAPNWQLPQRFQAYVRHELPLWLYFALLAVAGAGIFVAFRWLLSRQVAAAFGL
ncbi:type IVB secretion system protein IcmH/DotU [Chromobacterium sp. IIBBL 290-4]|uniref:type IVB secretion system protein IcmH/DotU n=1 Tax=Chromobacterium sp. IIBBL 290-4 TaxID=2953890 RepID=UPI0020B668A2|nr:type IVB secretion system protein IcmH/DotU [Chromobacterium sp. IIBBL 290-4]UTH76604.1 type IVB secretion system protein IcmH/DotU [Chromobacterium sp. IIBBL 290-4]